MAPAATTASAPSAKGVLIWRPTKIMNMRDLSKDDDFLSHLLVEKLGTGTVPLLVHKMDSSRRLPKTDAQDLLQIVRRLVVSKGPLQHAIRQAVDELLALSAIRYYLKSYTQKQINAFATHASRYFELYNPSGYIEIAHTSRYSHRTGKSELCILATRNLAPGTVVTELKGSMANLTDEEDKELKRTDLRNSDIRRDFSVIHSKQMKKNHLFLGPARFVNHDCDNNCELFREGKYITFRVLRPIIIGEEITAHYGDGYFGRKNRHCLCETCEKRGRGGYAPENAEEDLQPDSGSDSDSDSDSDTSSSDSDTEVDEADQVPNFNMNERRTRRRVYPILKKKESDSDESDKEDDNHVPLAGAQDIPGDGEIELTMEIDSTSELTSLTPSVAPSAAQSSPPLMTPGPEALRLPSCSSSLSSLSSTGDLLSTPTKRNSSSSSPYRSIISTRRQKAKEKRTDSAETNQQLVTPPLDATSPPETSNAGAKRTTRATSSLRLSARTIMGKGKGKEVSTPAPTPVKSRGGPGKEDVKIKKEETEPRTLRGRPAAANASETAKEILLPREVPRGPDGKPLPLCATCSNVLPVISVDSKVVWGLGIESSPRKKKNKQDCPRCMRHLAIYGQPWPCRIALHGTNFLPTPREEATPVDSSTRRVTHKALPVLDRKLAAAASASTLIKVKLKKREDISTERPAKRRKTEPGPGLGLMSARARKALAEAPRKKRHSLPKPAHLPTGEKRKRGRPRLRSPSAEVKIEENASQIGEDMLPQPRNPNGRFEKKPRSLSRKKTNIQDSPRTVLSRAERAIERGKAKDREGAEEEKNSTGTWTSPRRKRANESDVQFEELPSKRAYRRREENMLPFKKVLPRPASSFKGGRLFSNPTPLSFALQAWAGPMILDESSSEDDGPPVTPEDMQSPPATIVEAESSADLVLSSILVPAAALPRGALTFKPSPFNFAKRRWMSVSTSSCNDTRESSIEKRESPGKVPISNGLDRRSLSETHLKAEQHHGFALTRNRRTGLLYTPCLEGSPSNTEGNADMSDTLVGRFTPASDGYLSAGSSDVEDHPSHHLRHSYPGLTTKTIFYPKTTTFTADEPGPTPNFIHAGWDSCSDLSDA
ncbi:hypothetical protein BDZ94DRAFT_1215347 [Collybia nuda]|uniref:SET domain-containing protein n=1 Tax=Collybia nuda TaxID=64659 RepID=A0A9P5Y993_9AGAR|nr:hypothetical protein BDZ94DRAFT_1215347 [Collybia nuda]